MTHHHTCIVCGSRRGWIPTKWEGKPAYLCSICAGVKEPRQGSYSGATGGVKVANPKEKKPWQMTRDEFLEYGKPILPRAKGPKIIEFPDGTSTGLIGGGNLILSRPGQRAVAMGKTELTAGSWDKQGLRPIEIDQYRKYFVEKALSEGKTIPAKVLKDYPELARMTNPKNKKKIHPLAIEARSRYRDDKKAGHSAAAEYWRGQAGAFFTGNPKRVRYDKAKVDSAIKAAMKLQSKGSPPLYIFATAHGYTIDARKPPFRQSYIQVSSDGNVVKKIYDPVDSKYFTANPVSLYESFHGSPPKGLRRVNLPVPPKGTKLVMIGRLSALEYIPEKPSKLANTVYRHRMGDMGSMIMKKKPILASDAAGKNLYIIPDGAKTRMTERGIIG